jgi:hypothetical protein
MASRENSGSRASRGNGLNDSRDSNFSFLSKSENTGRNRFFSPKQIYDMPAEMPQKKNEEWHIMEFYKEFCAIVK